MEYEISLLILQEPATYSEPDESSLYSQARLRPHPASIQWAKELLSWQIDFFGKHYLFSNPLTFIRSIGLWRWHINITITILDITHRPVFYLKHDVSEIGFCLRFQVEPI
jgi:hypothetical protein